MSRKMKAPQGATTAHFGQEEFKVETDGTVVVDDEAAAALVGVAGYTFADEEAVQPEPGFVWMIATDAPVSLTVDGENVTIGVTDPVQIPLARSGDLLSHGLAYAPAPLVKHVATPSPIAPPADPLASLKGD